METTPFREVLPAELQRQTSDNPGLLILDILPQDHFDRRHLPGAGNACVYEVTFLQQVEAITTNKNTAIVLYGSGNTSQEAFVAADKLARAGYRNLAVLKGGLDGWRQAGLPLHGAAATEVDDPGTQYLPADGHYLIDIEKCRIEWTGRNANSSHTGTVRLTSGALDIAAGHIDGVFTIDMRSIANSDLEGDALQPVLLAHLNSDDFFFTRLFPTATFTLKRLECLDEPTISLPNARITGTLELRGVRAELNFPATLAPRADGLVVAEAHFDIDRTRWNVIYGSARFFRHLGQHLVFDPISLQIRIVAKAPSP